MIYTDFFYDLLSRDLAFILCRGRGLKSPLLVSKGDPSTPSQDDNVRKSQDDNVRRSQDESIGNINFPRLTFNI